MFAFVIKDLPYLKTLQPIIEVLADKHVPYVLFCWDVFREKKEYNRASVANIRKSSEKIIIKAFKTTTYNNDQQLLQLLKEHKITILVSVEINVWAQEFMHFFQNNNIKVCSVSYLTDSLWHKKKRKIDKIDRIYYTAKCIMREQHRHLDILYNKNRDRCFGSPIFDCLTQTVGERKDHILFLLPNMGQEHVPAIFGEESNFIRIVDHLYKYNKNIIFKLRKKQWLPETVKKYAKDIVYDGSVMYPPVIADLFNKAFLTIMFYSSGIYESVYSGSYVINIPIPFKLWKHLRVDEIQNYFKQDGLYNFDGVIESVSVERFLKMDNFNMLKSNETKRAEWVSNFIGDVKTNSYLLIAEDLLEYAKP